MRSLKTMGEEIKSNPQLVLLLLLSPLILQYVVWRFLPSLSGVSINDEVTSLPASEYLANVTSKVEFFATVASSQVSAVLNTVSKLHLTAFILGGVLGAFLMVEPVYRGSVINEIALLGRGRALIGRLLFAVVYGAFLVLVTLSAFWGVSGLVELSLGSRFFLALGLSLFLSTMSGLVVVSLLGFVSREPVVPLALTLTAGFLTTSSTTLNEVLLPFESLNYYLWNPKAVTLGTSLYAGLALYALLVVLMVKIFEGGDFY